MQAIGVTIVANGAVPAASAGALEAQLSRYQTQLADWCNCPSGKTSSGKEKIQELQDKVDAVKAQLERIETAKAQRQSTPDRVNRSPNSSAGDHTAVPGFNLLDELPASATRQVTDTAIGGLADAFA